jgi:hypothetical protein
VLLQQHIVAKALQSVGDGNGSGPASPVAGLWSYLTGTAK